MAKAKEAPVKGREPLASYLDSPAAEFLREQAAAHLAGTPPAAAVKPAPTPAAPANGCGWLWRSADGEYGVLRIKEGKDDGRYFARRLAPGHYLLAKLLLGEVKERQVRLHQSGRSDQSGSCTCDAGRHGKSCKHVKALTALRERGKL